MSLHTWLLFFFSLFIVFVFVCLIFVLFWHAMMAINSNYCLLMVNVCHLSWIFLQVHGCLKKSVYLLNQFFFNFFFPVTPTVRCDIMQLNSAASMINKTLLFPLFISLFFFCYGFFPPSVMVLITFYYLRDIVPYSFFFSFVCLFVCFYTNSTFKWMTSDFSGVWNTVFIIFNFVLVGFLLYIIVLNTWVRVWYGEIFQELVNLFSQAREWNKAWEWNI